MKGGKMKRIFCSMLIAVLVSGCTTVNPVLHTAGDRTAELKVGDTITTTGRDGRSSHFEIARISPDEICGTDQCVRKSDIVGLEVQEFSAGKTILLVGGVIAIVALVVAAAHAAAAASLLGAVPK